MVQLAMIQEELELHLQPLRDPENQKLPTYPSFVAKSWGIIQKSLTAMRVKAKRGSETLLTFLRGQPGKVDSTRSFPPLM